MRKSSVNMKNKVRVHLLLNNKYKTVPTGSPLEQGETFDL